MNYAKLIGAAMQLFPKKIKVTLVDAVTRIRVGQYKVAMQLLPQRFNKPLFIEIEGRRWQILKATPNNDDYQYSKKLILEVQETKVLQAFEGRVMTPSLPVNIPPQIDVHNHLDFILDIEKHQWRQLEFLPVSLLPVIQEELKEIEPIINGENLLLGYPSQHTRSNVGTKRLSVSFLTFCKMVNVEAIGNARFHLTAAGIVKNSFSIRTANYTYYGLMDLDQITELCLTEFDCVDDEFIKIVTALGLVLVDWSNGRVVMGMDETKGQRKDVSNEELISID